MVFLITHLVASNNILLINSHSSLPEDESDDHLCVRLTFTFNCFMSSNCAYFVLVRSADDEVSFDSLLSGFI